MECRVEEVLDVAMEIGMNLLRCGAEIRRVEDTIKYVCNAYGASEVDVFAIPTLIIATIKIDGQTYTSKVKRNLDVTTDLFRLEKYNKLSRKIVSTTPPLEVVREEIEKIATLKDYNIFIVLFGSILAAGGFAMFFGGTILDGISASIVAIIMTLFLRFDKIKMNYFVHILLCSLIGGFFSIVMCWIGLADNLSYVMSGAIMVVIPGLAIGTSIRDIMSNDILSGSIRLFQAIVISAAIAAGFSLFAQLYRGDVTLNSNAKWYVALIAAFISTVGFGIIFNNKYKHLWIVGIGGVLSCCVYYFSNLHLNNEFLSVMLGTVTATLLAEILARILKAPTTVFLIPTIIPFVPGALLFYMMYNLINGNIEAFKTNLSGMSLASLGIAVGIILASVFAQVVIKSMKFFKQKRA